MSVYDIHLDGTESVGPAGRYLVWHHSEGRPEIEDEDTLEHALGTARMWDDSEYGSFDFIEGPVGVVPEHEVDAWIGARDRRLYAAYRQSREDLTGRIRYYVEVRSLDGAHVALWSDPWDKEEALRDVAELNLPGRVRVYSVPYGTDARRSENRTMVMDWDGGAPA